MKIQEALNILADVNEKPKFDSYWDMIVYNANLTNDNGILVEAIRQWTILILTLTLPVLFVVSIRELHKAQKQWDLDQTVLTAELVKVVVFGLVEFFLLLLGGMMLCQCIQSSIRSIICGVFIVRYLVSHDDVERAKKLGVSYILVVNLFLIFMVVTAFIPEDFGKACNEKIVTWQWLAITTMDTMQTICLAATGILMYRRDKNIRESGELLTSLNRDMNTRFLRQVKFLLVFYIGAAFMDWVAYYGARRMFDSEDLGCVKNQAMVVYTNQGATYMLYYSLLSYFYAITMWYIFFQIPKNHGMLKKFVNKGMDDVEDMSVRSSMKYGEDNVRTMVKELESDRVFNSKMFKNSQMLNGTLVEQGTSESQALKRQQKAAEELLDSTESGGLQRKLSDSWLNTQNPHAQSSRQENIPTDGQGSLGVGIEEAREDPNRSKSLIESRKNSKILHSPTPSSGDRPLQSRQNSMLQRQRDLTKSQKIDDANMDAYTASNPPRRLSPFRKDVARTSFKGSQEDDFVSRQSNFL